MRQSLRATHRIDLLFKRNYLFLLLLDLLVNTGELMLFQLDLVLRVRLLLDSALARGHDRGLRPACTNDSILLPHVLDLLVARFFKRALNRDVQLLELRPQPLVHREELVDLLVLHLLRVHGGRAL